MERKTSFLLYAEQKEAIKRLNNEQRGLLLTALMAAAGGDMEPADQLDDSTGVAFDGIWLQVGIDRQKFEETSERRAEAGRNGGLASGEMRRQSKQTEANEAKASKPKQTKQTEANEAKESNGKQTKQTKQIEANEANRSKVKQTEANEANGSKPKQTKQNENENENENDSTTWKKESGKKKAAASSSLLPDLSEGEADRLNEAFAAFAEMRKKQKAPLTDDAARLTVSNLQKLATKDGRLDVDLAVAILNQSTQRSWRGVFPLKEDTAAAPPVPAAPVHKPNAFHNFEQRMDYDYDAIMQRERERTRQQAAADMATGPPGAAAV